MNVVQSGIRTIRDLDSRPSPREVSNKYDYITKIVLAVIGLVSVVTAAYIGSRFFPLKIVAVALAISAAFVIMAIAMKAYGKSVSDTQKLADELKKLAFKDIPQRLAEIPNPDEIIESALQDDKFSLSLLKKHKKWRNKAQQPVIEKLLIALLNKHSSKISELQHYFSSRKDLTSFEIQWIIEKGLIGDLQDSLGINNCILILTTKQDLPEAKKSDRFSSLHHQAQTSVKSFVKSSKNPLPIMIKILQDPKFDPETSVGLYLFEISNMDEDEKGKLTQLFDRKKKQKNEIPIPVITSILNHFLSLQTKQLGKTFVEHLSENTRQELAQDVYQFLERSAFREQDRILAQLFSYSIDRGAIPIMFSEPEVSGKRVIEPVPDRPLPPIPIKAKAKRVSNKTS